jgi:hypothetical protein
VLVVERGLQLEDVIGSHACSREASMRLVNSMPRGSQHASGQQHASCESTFLPVKAVNSVAKLKVTSAPKGFPLGDFTCLSATPCHNTTFNNIDTSALVDLKEVTCSFVEGTQTAVGKTLPESCTAGGVSNNVELKRGGGTVTATMNAVGSWPPTDAEGMCTSCGRN